MAFFIKFRIYITLNFAVFFRGNNGYSAIAFNGFYDLVCVIPFIRQDGFKPNAVQQNNRLRTVVTVSAGDNKFQGIAERIANGVDF